MGHREFVGAGSPEIFAAESILKAYSLSPTDCQIYQALCEILPAAGMTSPPTPLDPPQPSLKRGEPEEATSAKYTEITSLKVPLFKGDLGGSNSLLQGERRIEAL
jgi:hypothetical protein